MAEIYVEAELNTEALAEQLVSEMTQEELLEFVLSVDAWVAEVSFTKELIEKLQESFEGEGE